MHSERPASPKDRSRAAAGTSARWLLAIAFAAFLVPINGITWSTAAPQADAPADVVRSTAPSVSQAARPRDAAPARAAPTLLADSSAQRAADEAPWTRRSAANASTLSAANPASLIIKAGANATVARAAPDASPPDVSRLGYRSPGALHKISVGDQRLVQTLKAQGGRVIGDYGSFVLMEASDAVANTLTKHHDAQIVDENNLVLLNAGAIDTSTQGVQARRAALGATSGKQMHLIQFAGPIRPEWYQALAATGVHIVTYIPTNAYLVYGTAQSLQAVQQLAANRSLAQWDGAYTAAYRIDPAITASANSAGGAAQGKNGTPAQLNLSAKGNEQFSIQMVEDAAENASTLALIDQYKLEPIIKQDSMLGYLNVRVTLPRDVVIGQLAERGDVVSIQQWITPQKRDERQDIIITGNLTGNAPTTGTDYLAYLTGKGFTPATPASFAVNLSDSGIDNATTTPNHFALYAAGSPASPPTNSRVIYNRLIGTPNSGSTLQGCDGHGNENAHIISGYVPTGRWRRQLRRLSARRRLWLPLWIGTRAVRQDRIVGDLRSQHLHLAGLPESRIAGVQRWRADQQQQLGQQRQYLHHRFAAVRRARARRAARRFHGPGGGQPGIRDRLCRRQRRLGGEHGRRAGNGEERHHRRRGRERQSLRRRGRLRHRRHRGGQRQRHHLLLEPRADLRRAQEAGHHGPGHARIGRRRAGKPRQPGGQRQRARKSPASPAPAFAEGWQPSNFFPAGQQWYTASSGHQPFDAGDRGRRGPHPAALHQPGADAAQSGDDQGADDELRPLHDRRRRERHPALEQPGHGRDQPQQLLRRRSPRRTSSTTRSRRRLLPPPASSAYSRGRCATIPSRSG